MDGDTRESCKSFDQTDERMENQVGSNTERESENKQIVLTS